ncbi:hypothetical protein [Frankia sp. R82]|uniref:glutamine amidotransferase-related protein n=1 Tax=Frankia sp. R82 TaxID=2950553 RepID=UPI002043625D|nr:hypothetical protein [Frankia sp. R82]MCM3883583.1 hypothetical protein [Frankia sp. R82]
MSDDPDHQGMPLSSSPAAEPVISAGKSATPPRTAAPYARVALVGDRSAEVAAHARIPELLEALRLRDGLPLDAYWIPTDEIFPAAPGGPAAGHGPADPAVSAVAVSDPAGSAGFLAGFDGIWLVPGSPYASEAGALAAVRIAREQGIPLLGTCGGLQHVALEFARSVCGRPDAAHAENDPGAPEPLIVPIECALDGHEGVVLVTPNSLAERLIGADRTVGRYYCSYGINPSEAGLLLAHGLRFSGVDETGEVRVLELPDHPFFLATLFQPELGSDAGRVHPVIRGFAEAAVARAAAQRVTARGVLTHQGPDRPGTQGGGSVALTA